MIPAMLSTEQYEALMAQCSDLQETLCSLFSDVKNKQE